MEHASRPHLAARNLFVFVFMASLAACQGGEIDDSVGPVQGGDSGPVSADDPGAGVGPGAGNTCGEQQFAIQRTIPDMLIVLDRSGSMGDGWGTTLWQMSRAAIYDITAAMDQQIRFGLYVFPSEGSPHACTNYFSCQTAAGTLVPVGDATSAKIKSALSSMQACGGTPTAAALVKARQYFATLPGDGRPRAILLATDGAPNCNGSLNPKTCTCTFNDGCWDGRDCLDDASTYAALDSLCAAGIKTYVLGLGSSQSMTSVLGGMAQHGCTATPYAANDAASVKKAFQDITGGVASCSFTVECSKIQSAALVNFYFDGKVVPRRPDHTSGWDWTTSCAPNSPTKGAVEFFGQDCAAIKNQTVKLISAKFGCATQIEQ
jgi:hypothetical protein